MNRSTPSAAAVVVAVLLGTGLAGCGQGSEEATGSTAAPTTAGDASRTAPSPDTPVDTTPGRRTGPRTTTTATDPGGSRSGRADLTIRVRGGPVLTWHLTCGPAGGSHPDPERACRVLAGEGASALSPVPKDRMCTEIYGGPQTAEITGTWRGEKVLASLKRTNGCELGRWSALEGLLPAAAEGV